MKLIKHIARYTSEYLDYRILFFIDLFISVVASCISALLVFFLVPADELLYAGLGRMAFFIWAAISIPITPLCMYVLKTYRIIVRHVTLHDIFKFFVAFALKEFITFLVIVALFNGNFILYLILGLGIDYALTLFGVLVIRIAMAMVYSLFRRRVDDAKVMKILVYRTYEKSVSIVTRLAESPHYKVMGFISDEQKEKYLTINDKPIYYYNNEDDVVKIISDLKISAVLYPTTADAQKEQNGMLAICTRHGVKSLIAPSIDEVVDGKVMKKSIREVKIEDLLGRDEIRISMNEVISNFNGKTIMVTGAAGSIGSELCRQLATFGIKHLVMFDNAETPMHNLRLEFEARFPNLNFTVMIGDVRQSARLDFAFRTFHPDIVFHAAAYKHVPLMEENPCESVLVNVFGSRNVADKCLEYDVEKMIMISTDKAVNPTNIMGCSKRLAEIYVQSLGLAVENGQKQGKTKFITTRFGNVLGSNGSVIPRFREQIEKGGPVTVTHPDITRFFMTIPEACRLVMEAATISKGNEILVFDMGASVRIDDLARKMCELAGLEVGKDIDIEYTGLRPGEKLYEEVLSNSENTHPTSHSRIRIADVRKYEYGKACDIAEKLRSFAYDVKIPEMVMLMKDTVPEYISKNSEFEKYDKHE